MKNSTQEYFSSLAGKVPPKKRKRVYIASPYTKGDVAINVRKQITTFTILLNEGYIPFAPLMSHFIHLVNPQSYDTWMQWDLDWLDTCDIVLRLEGESEGADKEVAMAKEKGIKVVYGLKELL